MLSPENLLEFYNLLQDILKEKNSFIYQNYN